MHESVAVNLVFSVPSTRCAIQVTDFVDTCHRMHAIHNPSISNAITIRDTPIKSYRRMRGWRFPNSLSKSAIKWMLAVTLLG